MHHMGVDRTLYLARSFDTDVTRQSIQKVVRNCGQCQSLDPDSGVWKFAGSSLHQTMMEKRKRMISVRHPPGLIADFVME